MEQVRAKIKKWGNSFGVIIPKEIISREGLKEDHEVFVTFQSKRYTTVGEIMEMAKEFNFKKRSKKTIQKRMDEIDKDLWPEEE